MTGIAVTHSSNVDAVVGSMIEAFIFLPDVVAEVGDVIIDDVRSELLPQLQKQPPRRQYPQDYTNGRLEWTSDKQQRWYWANIGKPHVRTGRLAKGWYVRSKQSRNTYRFMVGNDSKAAQYVYGSLDQRGSNAARKPQQRFHQITGWPLIVETINPALEEARNKFASEIFKRLGEMVKVGSRRRSTR